MIADSSAGEDPIVDEILGMLKQYEQDHPGARTDTYRYNSASVRIKIEDPRFSEMSKGDRHDAMWDDYVSQLSLEAQADVSMLILVAPGEQHMLDLEFSEPSRSFT